MNFDRVTPGRDIPKPNAGAKLSGNKTQHGSIPRRSLNRRPCFWPKVHRFGHLSLEAA